MNLGFVSMIDFCGAHSVGFNVFKLGHYLETRSLRCQGIATRVMA
jgi:hypothetical protein